MTSNIKHPRKAIVEQTTNNTTSWIGHQDNKDIIGGQTFTSPSESVLEAIEVFTSVVTTPAHVVMSLHTFDPQLKTWGPSLGTANVELNRSDNGKWKSFNMPGLSLNKGKTYGFRLESPNGCIGVGETVGTYKTPLLVNGQEWKFTNHDKKGQSFSYFSLAFKVEVRA
ncbi:MAG: hypothetical protein JWP81_1665 [Ferruginibacter sp.]|nr:hypothetical protein [Ferruginibacter sp.]